MPCVALLSDVYDFSTLKSLLVTVQGALDTLSATIKAGTEALKPPGLSLKGARSMAFKVQRDITRVTSLGGLPIHEHVVAGQALAESLQAIVDEESSALREHIDEVIKAAQDTLDWSSIQKAIDDSVRAGLKPQDEGAKRGWDAIEELKARKAAPAIKAAEEAKANAIHAAERAAEAKAADELAAQKAAEEKAEAETAKDAVVKEEAEALAAEAQQEKEEKEAGECTTGLEFG